MGNGDVDWEGRGKGGRWGNSVLVVGGIDTTDVTAAHPSSCSMRSSIDEDP